MNKTLWPVRDFWIDMTKALKKTSRVGAVHRLRGYDDDIADAAKRCRNAITVYLSRLGEAYALIGAILWDRS